MTVESGTLEIRTVSRAVAGSRHTGSGAKVPAKPLRIAEYAAGSEVVVHADISEIKTPDFRLLSRFFASSMHVPVRVDGVQGVVNFWSTERNAFPEEAIGLLEVAAESLSRQ